MSTNDLLKIQYSDDWPDRPFILCCGRCHGSGREPGTVEAKEWARCSRCMGSGYPAGYKPPSLKVVTDYAFPDH